MTNDDYKKLVSEHIDELKADEHVLDEPIPLFNDDGTFNPDNWNGLDLLRQYALRVYDGEINDYSVHCWTYSDNWYAVFNVDYNTSIFMRWYKSRGRTELITCNDHPCTINEYIYALNEIIEEEKEEK